MSMTAQELGFKGNRHYEMVKCANPECDTVRPVSTVDLADPRYTGLCRYCNISTRKGERPAVKAEASLTPCTCHARHWRIDSAGLGTCTVCGGQKRFNGLPPVW